jgi:hypothetical protein
MKPFSIDAKSPAKTKLWAIGGCIGALAIAQVCSGAHGSIGAASVRMLVVLACFAGAAFWLIRKLPNLSVSGSKLEPALKIVGKTALSPKNGLALVEADGIRVLVAYGDGFARVLPLDACGAHKENVS